MERQLILKKFSVFFLILFLLPAVCLSDEVSEPVAHLVAQNYLAHYVTIYGNWAGSNHPKIIDSELIEYRDLPVAYNFKVHPKGHLLIPCWDEFSPVFLYSTTSEFIPERVEDSPSIESWIIPEIYNVYKILTKNRRTIEKTIVYSDTRVAQAWEWLSETDRRFSSKAEGYDYKFATVGPLLTTIWTQESPYNQYCPSGISGSCDNCLVGCVATAWSQLMKYWEWPTTGTGSHSYEWNGQTLSADFNHEYYWSLMPNELTASSTSAQKDAVARLCSDVGIAADMNYGCDESGSNAFANDVLDVYFKYKDSMQLLTRRNYTAAQWFALFKAEFDANPGRPIVFSIYGVTGGGHETVADGYETGATDKVHVNFGWAGNYDGYYDVTNNFTAQFSWRGDHQFIVTHIEPDYSSTTIYVDPSGSCGGNSPCYTTVQSAVNAASTGTTIKILQGTYSENVTLSTSKQVTLSGGWNSSYTSQSSISFVSSLVRSAGSLIAKRVGVQQ